MRGSICGQETSSTTCNVSQCSVYTIVGIFGEFKTETDLLSLREWYDMETRLIV